MLGGLEMTCLVCLPNRHVFTRSVSAVGLQAYAPCDDAIAAFSRV